MKHGHILGVGTATDPYQPAERRFGRTRQALEGMQGLRGVSIFITTKSNLVTRDAALLKRLSEHNEVSVTLTVTTMNTDLARLTEPYAPRPDLRIQAVAELNSAGVRAGVIANPVLPLLTDSEENLESVARAAKAAGAIEFGANVVFLKPSAQRVFFPFLADKFPQHLRRYEANFAAGAFLKGELSGTHSRNGQEHPASRRHPVARYGSSEPPSAARLADVTLLGRQWRSPF